jgi:glyoxylase-like metal-dependent hydrolase (beta-lactamase superfamily II)
VPKPLRGAGETVYWLPAPRALVFGDRLIGAGGGRVRLCPESWLRQVTVDRQGLARLMRALIELPVELLLPSHGDPVLHDGRAELARALREVEQEQ